MPLVVFEGIDGCGKTTQMQRLCARLDQAGIAYRTCREPGGTVLGERLRDLLLDPATEACPRAELLAYQVARAQLVHAVLRPALAAGELVILDRFYHSSLAYQVHALGLDETQGRAAIDVALAGLRADVVLYLRISAEEGARRRAQARGEDRIEARGLAYLDRVVAGYEALVGREGLIALDAGQPMDDLAAAVWREVAPLLSP